MDRAGVALCLVFCTLELITGRILEILEMIGTERFGDFIFLIQPFSQVHQLAPLRTERPILAGKPIPGLLTRWATHCFHALMLLRLAAAQTQAQPKFYFDLCPPAPSFLPWLLRILM